MNKIRFQAVVVMFFTTVAMGCNYWTTREEKKHGVKSKVALAQINTLKGKYVDANIVKEYKQLQIAASEIATEYAKRSSVQEQLKQSVDDQLLNRISYEKIGITYDQLEQRMEQLVKENLR